MKDAAGRVIYVGKAKNLRSRAGSYFLKAAAEELRTARLGRRNRDIDFIGLRERSRRPADGVAADQGHPAEIQPGTEGRQDVSLPEDHDARGLSPRRSHPRTARSGRQAVRPVCQRRALRGAVQVLQRIFKFRTCTLDIDEDDERWRWFRPCLLASIDQCTAPCNLRISQGGLPPRHPPAADVPGRQRRRRC